ncbi:MAG: phosphotransacetylase family protein [bacterium]|nr:phosphotransacetylase family protein [bacterium]
MISLYIGSTSGYSGKSLVCLGLGNRFAQDGYRLSYMKPIGKPTAQVGETITDEDAIFIAKALSLSDPLETICPIVVTQDMIVQAYQNKTEGLEGRLINAHQKLSQHRDIMLIGGGSDLYEGAFLGLSGLYIVKRLLDAKVILIDRFTNEVCVDCILGIKESLGDRLCGVILNRVVPERIDYVQRRIIPFLSTRGIDTFGIIPYDQLLNAVTVKELSEALGAEIICCHDQVDELVENYVIGAMTVDRALKYFRQKKNKAVITGGDRPEIQLAALETSTKCIILTGNLYPSELILVQAEEHHVPVMVAKDDTQATVEKVERIFGRIRVRDQRKVARALELIDQCIDFPTLYRKIGLA